MKSNLSVIKEDLIDLYAEKTMIERKIKDSKESREVFELEIRLEGVKQEIKKLSNVKQKVVK